MALFVVVAAAGSARAQERPVTSAPAAASVELQMASPTPCASMAMIADRVTARSTRIIFVSAAPAVPIVRAAIRANPQGGVSADLSVQLPGGRKSHRRLSAPSCADAVDATALLITMMFDPAAAAEPPSPPGAAPGSPSTDRGETAVSPEIRRGPLPDDRAPTGAGGARPQMEAPPRATHEAAPSPKAAMPQIAPSHPAAATDPAATAVPGSLPTPDPPAHRRIDVGVLFDGVIGSAPRWLWGGGVQATGSFDRPHLLSPAIRLSLSSAGAGPLPEAGGSADFALYRLGLELCLVRLRLGPAAVRGCGTAALERLSARGTDTYDGQTRSVLLATAGGAMVLTVDLGGGFVASASGDAGYPAQRDAFAFSPTVFYRMAPMTFDLALGLGLRFP